MESTLVRIRQLAKTFGEGETRVEAVRGEVRAQFRDDVQRVLIRYQSR